jgi:hypothetical protein
MKRKHQNFTNPKLPTLRDEIWLRRKVVWILEGKRQASLKNRILQDDARWKQLGKTAIKFDLRSNWDVYK